MQNRILNVLFLLILSCLVQAATDNEEIGLYANQIKAEQSRIDRFDGNEDQTVTLKSEVQTAQATEVYITSCNKIIERIINSTLLSHQKIKQLQQMLDILRDVEEKNVHFYTRFGSIFSIIRKVQTTRDDKKLEDILKSNVYSSLNLIPFYADRPVAEPFLVYAASQEPAELLLHYKEYNKRPLNELVLNAVVYHAPMKVRTYLYSSNAIQKKVKLSTDPVVMTLYRIVNAQSSASRSAILLNDVHKGKISISKAHEISQDDNLLFDYLLKMRTSEKLIGVHSVDEALTIQCLKRVRVTNELHNESDARRFASINKYNAYEMYTLMVYSEDEIFTSTFLGMFDRMMRKMEEESSYGFLHELEFNQFRTFIKMCAGYNVLSDFLAKMSDFEKQMLFKRLVEGLESSGDNLKSAVAIADTYGSIDKEENRMLLEESILRYYQKIRYSNPAAEKLYGLLISILKLGDGQDFDMSKYESYRVNLTTLPINRIFKDGKNIQQHFFFDDPDGKASYNTFLERFRSINWRIYDKGLYIVIKSVTGKKVEIYANKPETEYRGQRAISDYFAEIKRWPDVVVHRGHSYFTNTAIESLTPNAEIVFLGSCGGYNNINQVLNYSPDAQIISSKQIGTMWVNNELCYRLNETIRMGEDVVWESLWKQVDRALGSGNTADRRFNDYIPPHKNLGALLIKTYRAMI